MPTDEVLLNVCICVLACPLYTLGTSYSAYSELRTGQSHRITVKF